MQNEFEKKVRETLFGVEMPAADKIWQGIRSQIGKPAKKRRLLVFWTTGSVLLLAGLAVIYMVYRQPASNLITTHSVVKNNVAATNKQVPGLNDSGILALGQTSRLPVIEQSTLDQTNNLPVIDHSVAGQTNISPIIEQPTYTSDDVLVDTVAAVTMAVIYPKKAIDSTHKPAAQKNRGSVQNALPQKTLTSKPSLIKFAAEVAVNKVPLVKKQTVNNSVGRSFNGGIISTAPATIGWTSICAMLTEKPLAYTTRLYTQSPVAGFSEMQGFKDLSETKKSQIKTALTVLPMRNAISDLSSKTNKKVSKKVQWGFNTNVGIANLVANKGNIATDLQFSNVSSPLPGNQSATTMQQVKYRAGIANGIGVSIEVPLNEHFSMSAGLGYQYYSTRSLTGTRVPNQRNFFDSTRNSSVTVREYFSAANANFTTDAGSYFNNRFHFAQVPLLLRYTPVATSKRPITITAGLVPTLLFGSKALNYDRQNNVSYVDKTHLKNLQVLGGLGVAFTIKNYSSKLVQAGPVVRYGFGSINKNSDRLSQHLLFVGLQANILFKNN